MTTTEKHSLTWATVKQWLSTTREILPASQSVTEYYQPFGNHVLRVGLTIETFPVHYNFLGNQVGYNPPKTTVKINPATEAELSKAIDNAKSEKDRYELRKLVELVRGESDQAPLRIEIVNASELQKDTILQIKRDDAGKMTGAVASKVP